MSHSTRAKTFHHVFHSADLSRLSAQAFYFINLSNFISQLNQFKSVYLLTNQIQVFKVGARVATGGVVLKARSHDPFLRIRFLVPKTGSGRSYSPISRFCFCGENVGRSFVMCSHDPFFSTNKESSIWRQNDHAKFVGAFHLSRRVSDENRACSIPSVFFKITDPFDGRSFLMCSHDPFIGTNKNRILENGSCEQAFSQGRRSLSGSRDKIVVCWISLDK